MTTAFASSPHLVFTGQQLPRCLSRRRPRQRSLLLSAATSPAAATRTPRQVVALESGTWFKLICGASSHDLPRIRNLSFLYALLGVDCVDAAADPAVVAAVRAGFHAACHRRRMLDRAVADADADPWLMVSVNDHEDPHFRKAEFPISSCPPACPHPCEAVCPADAIDVAAGVGVLPDICYGCGRCIPICPQGIIDAVSYVHSTQSIIELVASVDALEIHTQNGHDAEFCDLWRAIGETARGNLKLLAVSFPNPGSDTDVGSAIRRMWRVLRPLPPTIQLVWQTDGRPMSGDIGRGTANASVALASRVRIALRENNVPGHVQLAGGTNNTTAPRLAKAGLLHVPGEIAGVAIGGYARKVCGVECPVTCVSLLVRLVTRPTYILTDVCVLSFHRCTPDCLSDSR
jgi:Fe-S-cluster-containing hydrogenase component 2